MKKLWITVGATAATVLLAGGVAVAATGALAPQPEPEPTKTSVSIPVETPEPVETVTPITEPVVETPTPEPAVEAPAPQPVPPAAKRCPAGSQANSSDGVNDTSCFPTICFSIAVPDANHPECDVAFKP